LIAIDLLGLPDPVGLNLTKILPGFKNPAGWEKFFDILVYTKISYFCAIIQK